MRPLLHGVPFSAASDLAEKSELVNFRRKKKRSINFYLRVYLSTNSLASEEEFAKDEFCREQKVAASCSGKGKIIKRNSWQHNAFSGRILTEI